jgi:hypothetical protein
MNVFLESSVFFANTSNVQKEFSFLLNDKLGLAQPLTENYINRSHIIGPINNGKGHLICRFCNWKVKKLYLYEEEKSQKQRLSFLQIYGHQMSRRN